MVMVRGKHLLNLDIDGKKEHILNVDIDVDTDGKQEHLLNADIDGKKGHLLNIDSNRKKVTTL